MITYKGKKAFKFADLETDCVVTITVDFDNKELDEEGLNIFGRMAASLELQDTFGLQLKHAYEDYVACFILNLAQKVGELSVQGNVYDLLSDEDDIFWIEDNSLGVTFDYIEWSPELSLALQECPYKEERPWKEW